MVVVVVVWPAPPVPKANPWFDLVEYVTSWALSPTPPPTPITVPVGGNPTSPVVDVKCWVVVVVVVVPAIALDPLEPKAIPPSIGTELWSKGPEPPKFKSIPPVLAEKFISPPNDSVGVVIFV